MATNNKKRMLFSVKNVALIDSEYFKDKRWKNMSHNLPNPSLQSIKQHWQHCFQPPVQGTKRRFSKGGDNVFFVYSLKNEGE